MFGFLLKSSRDIGGICYSKWVTCINAESGLDTEIDWCIQAFSGTNPVHSLHRFRLWGSIEIFQQEDYAVNGARVLCIDRQRTQEL